MDGYINDRSGVTGLRIYFFHALLEATVSHDDTSLGIIVVMTNFVIHQDFEMGLWRHMLLIKE